MSESRPIQHEGVKSCLDAHLQVELKSCSWCFSRSSLERRDDSKLRSGFLYRPARGFGIAPEANRWSDAKMFGNA